MTKRYTAFAAALLLTFTMLFAGAFAEEAEAPQPRYRATATCAITIRKEPSRDAEAVGYYAEGARVQIVSYEPGWLQVVKDGVTGWILRHTVSDHTVIDEDEMPFGAVPGEYAADVGSACVVRSAPEDGADALFLVSEGERLALIDIQDGWGKVIYWRQYGYVKLDEHISSIEPVLPVEDAQPGDILAAYCSFYSLSGNMVPSRIKNIAVGCSWISMTIQPGERFSFNEIAGPYGPAKGYEKAMSFFDGGAVPSYGGGTCQISSTLYNTLMPLQGHGIDILYRRPHGPGGASYLPHGADAAVGSDSLDFIFRNEFDFPVRIDARTHGNGVLYVALLRAE